MPGKILVFDLDGTLIDTAPDLLASLNYAIGLEALSPLPIAGFSGILGRGGREMIRIAHQAQNRRLAPETLERLYIAFIEHYKASIPGTSSPYPGALAALDRFEQAGYRLAICTNKTEDLAIRLMAALGLSARFGAICGADTFARAKPDPLHLYETIRKAGGAIEQAIMIGDSKTDVDAAKAAGIPVIGVDFGYTDRHISEFEPSRVVSSFDEMTLEMAARLLELAQSSSRSSAHA